MDTLEIITVLVATAATFGWISSRVLRMPITIGTMLLAVIATAVLHLLNPVAPGLHAWAEHLVHRINFEVLILHGMLPLLLFAGAFLLDLEQLARQKLPVTLLSILGTVLSFFAVAALMMLLSGTRAPWMECLIFGALISPTDPIAVLELLRRIGIPKSVEAQLAGESLFNDGIGAVLFITMIEIARGQTPTASHVAGLLLLKAGGAIALAIVAAWLVSRLMCLVESYQVEILLTLTLALGGYVVADIAHLSAPLEAVVAGIALRYFNRRQPKGLVADTHVDEFWTMLDEVQNAILFVLLGLEAMAVNVDAMTFRSGLAAVLSVNLVRFAVVALCLGIAHIWQRQRRSSLLTLTWGGLRGGLSIALARGNPASVTGAPTGRWSCGATYMVVVFSIIGQGGTLQYAISWWKRRTSAARKTAPAVAE